MKLNRIYGLLHKKTVLFLTLALLAIITFSVIHSLQSSIMNLDQQLKEIKNENIPKHLMQFENSISMESSFCYSNSTGMGLFTSGLKLPVVRSKKQEMGSSSLSPIVVYNRVPKTGSTSFSHKVYALTTKNNIFVAHVNISRNVLKMSLSDQFDMVRNMTLWKKNHPVFYHGHFAYVSFEQFGAPNPLYINILREPLDRLISHYYFLRYGDNLRKGLHRIRSGDTTTFDDCVAQQGHDCQPNKLWLQIPFLCGQKAECWKPGSQWALAEAKKNLLSKYLLVGVTENLEEFLIVLEATVPSMFRNLARDFHENKNSFVRKTMHKDMPSNRTIQHMKNTKAYKMEKELYDLAVKQFNYVKQLTTYTDDYGQLRPLGRQYRYEKIYGPKGSIS